jgi:hypothetical protein
MGAVRLFMNGKIVRRNGRRHCLDGHPGRMGNRSGTTGSHSGAIALFSRRHQLNLLRIDVSSSSEEWQALQGVWSWRQVGRIRENAS